jgi:hypothetical protein
MSDDSEDHKDKAENELGKQFFFFWMVPAIGMSISGESTHAARWFVGFPLVWWLYHNIKKRFTH